MRSLTKADQRAVVERAAAFLRAYLDYEIGAADEDVRRALRRSATRAFARELLEHAPDLSGTGRPPRGQVSSLELTDDPNAPAVEVAATISRSGHLSALALELERAGDGWRVSRLR